MTKARNIIAEAMASYLLGKVQYHKANVRLYLEHPAGIGAVSYTHLTLPTSG